ncbi:MAG TPA: hypothetical protein VHQ23_02310 [Ilumatobacteraceae bacterium]|jgi:hypothetical protein|nr:hypothetical protein [Ilumatobacteraceae bacterium]
MTTNIKFWLAGLVTGVVLVERWRRYGRQVSAERMRNDLASATTITVSTEKPKASKAIVAGAKADAGRLKDLLARTVMSPAETETVS